MHLLLPHFRKQRLSTLPISIQQMKFSKKIIFEKLAV